MVAVVQQVLHGFSHAASVAVGGGCLVGLERFVVRPYGAVKHLEGHLSCFGGHAGQVKDFVCVMKCLHVGYVDIVPDPGPVCWGNFYFCIQVLPHVALVDLTEVLVPCD